MRTVPDTSHFIRHIIESDLSQGMHSQIRLRFPPEPNGFLHIGHIKSIALNFGLARDYKGICHLRFDDTNPETESMEFVEDIKGMIKWLGFTPDAEFFASDYFPRLYEAAHYFIQQGLAYVDEQSVDEIRLQRGSLITPGINSPYRDSQISDNQERFEKMKAGVYTDNTAVLRLKIDMSHPNINMRDPIIYRVRHRDHYRMGNKWCIYPLYDYTHCLSDAFEKITHSLCTLEFEDHRVLYNWILENLKGTEFVSSPLPRQIEFSRLNVTHHMTSKRKLALLVDNQYVEGWDDPRLSTIRGLRRRGYSPSALLDFCERVGVTKDDAWSELSYLEEILRQHLNNTAPRIFGLLNPLKMIIENCPEDYQERCTADFFPGSPEKGQRQFSFCSTIWIDRADFMLHPEKGFFRLTLGGMVRLRYAYVVHCHAIDQDPTTGEILSVRCTYLPETKSGTPGSNSVKVKGNIQWLSENDSCEAAVHLYQPLFSVPHPAEVEEALLPQESSQTCIGRVDHIVLKWPPLTVCQWERVGYFVTDLATHSETTPVFNLTTFLKSQRLS